jgi:diguanylate cyclase (GGDEF)-like protein
MDWPARFTAAFLGTDPQLRRMMRYWSATAMLYVFFVGIMYAQSLAGAVARDGTVALGCFAGAGIAAFYVLVRASGRLGLAPTLLAVLQGLFGISCNIWAYSITGPLRGATLMGLMVVVVFCTFALRPRQTLLLALCGLLGMGGTMWWHHAHDPLHYPAYAETFTFALMAACSLAVTFLTGEMNKLRARLKAKKDILEAALDTIRTLATTDELTAVANRRHMNEVLADREQGKSDASDTSDASETPRPVCIALLDIDFFKRINDGHGHAAGDAVLRAFAARLRAGVRRGDVLARWGGEEFMLLLPDTGPEQALALLERIRADVAASAMPGLDPALRISFSGGLGIRRGNEPFSDTIGRADKALYRAKATGRNRILVE